MTEDDAKRLEEIREGVIRSEFTPIDDVYFLLKRIDRVTAERDELSAVMERCNRKIDEAEAVTMVKDVLYSDATEPCRGSEFAAIPAPDPEADARIEALLKEGEQVRRELEKRTEPMKREPKP